MKLSVGVIFGGKNLEHEMSIITAIQAMNNIDTEKYDEAAEKCSYLRKELQDELLEEINKARNGGA